MAKVKAILMRCPVCKAVEEIDPGKAPMRQPASRGKPPGDRRVGVMSKDPGAYHKGGAARNDAAAALEELFPVCSHCGYSGPSDWTFGGTLYEEEAPAPA